MFACTVRYRLEDSIFYLCREALLCQIQCVLAVHDRLFGIATGDTAPKTDIAWPSTTLLSKTSLLLRLHIGYDFKAWEEEQNVFLANEDLLRSLGYDLAVAERDVKSTFERNHDIIPACFE